MKELWLQSVMLLGTWKVLIIISQVTQTSTNWLLGTHETTIKMESKRKRQAWGTQKSTLQIRWRGKGRLQVLHITTPLAFLNQNPKSCTKKNAE